MTVPGWVANAVFYQIFPDRFANGDRGNDPPNVHRWNSKPTVHSFFGGDLRGIIQQFDYLLDLGINAIYLNPIFQAASPHRYNTTDYFRIDPILGDLNDFQHLLDVAHRNGVHLILDGVFNHCGRGFFAFNDVLENGEHSPYKGWFHFFRFPVDAFSPGDATDYVGWWNLKSLPKFNTANPKVRKYLLDVARYWIEQGADGWRLDVPNEIDDDEFWAEFRHTVKSVNPDAYILGEIWHPDPRWIGDSHFDGLMNYPLRSSILDVLAGKTSVKNLADMVAHLLKVYPEDNVSAMYNLLGSHDTERLVTVLDNDLRKVALAYSFVFSFPGVPAIYYGDEVGLEGGKDPDCRRTFPWEPSRWKEGLYVWVKHLISLRQRYNVFRQGSYRQMILDEDKNFLAFSRSTPEDQVIIASHWADSSCTVRIPVGALGWQDGQRVHDMLTQVTFYVQAGHLDLTLQGYQGMWLKTGLPDRAVVLI